MSYQNIPWSSRRPRKALLFSESNRKSRMMGKMHKIRQRCWGMRLHWNGLCDMDIFLSGISTSLKLHALRLVLIYLQMFQKNPLVPLHMSLNSKSSNLYCGREGLVTLQW